MGRWPVSLGLIAIAACQSEPAGPVSVPLADAASVRIFAVVNGDDWTGHVPLTTGYTVRIKVRLYVADGREIEPLVNPLQVGFSFNPTSLATATVADSALLLEDVTPQDPPDSDGELRITLTEPATGTSKTFGPFYVLVHPSAGAQ